MTDEENTGPVDEENPGENDPGGNVPGENGPGEDRHVARSGRRQVGRRDLIIGGASLVVGAGLAQAANVVAYTPPPAEPHVPSPGEELMTEHGVLTRVLLAYRAAGDQLAAGQTPPAQAIGDAAQLISSYVESFHEGLEEAYVFPRVRAEHAQLVQTLLVQHDRGRHLTASILLAAAGDLTSPSTREALRSDLAAFVRMYEPHEAWEDTVIYPALRKATSQRTLDLLAERFASLENKQFGDHALAQMVERVSGIEQQLGIADLASFTP